MQRTTTQIKDQIVRRGASELVSAMLENEVFFETESAMKEWVDGIFDLNMIGQSDGDYDEIMDIMMAEVNDRVYDFFMQAQQGILQKAFTVQKVLEYDPSL